MGRKPLIADRRFGSDAFVGAERSNSPADCSIEDLAPRRRASCRRGRPDGARVVQLRGELVPAAHFETLRDQPEVLRERLEGARLIPELELVDFSGYARASPATQKTSGYSIAGAVASTL